MEYYNLPSMETISIIKADCMEELKKLPDESIDCVITDPPYFIDRLTNNWDSNYIKKDTKNSHIKHLEHKQAPLTDQVLQERLEALPAEKKEALLELLG